MKDSEKLRAIGARAETIAIAERQESEDVKNNPDEFVVYGQGLVNASVCSSLPLKEVCARMARLPTGVGPWHISDDTEFAAGQPMPSPCDQRPATHKHYLFHC